MSDKLITLDLLKKFGETCKASFQEVSEVTYGEGNIVELQFNVDLDGDYVTYLDIKGLGDEGFLDAQIYYSGMHAISNNGNITIKKATLLIESGISHIFLILSDPIENIHISSSVTSNAVVYRALTGVYISQYRTPGAEEVNLQNIYTGASETTSFTVKDAAGEDIQYTAGREFSSILAAGKLANTFDFELAEKSDGGQGLDFDTNGSRIIQIPWREYKAGEGVSISKDYEISSTAVSSIATKNDLGVVKIGDGISITEDGTVSAQEIDRATASKAGTVMLGADSNNGERLPLQVDSEGRAYVNIPDAHRFTTMPTPSLEWSNSLVEYIGETTSEFTKGYFYNCLPKVTISITGIYPIDGVDPGYMFMQYIQDKCWDDGTAMSAEAFLQNGWILKYNDSKWTLSYGTTYSYSFPESDFTLMGFLLPSKTLREQNFLSFLITDASSVYQWVQKNVQPAGYINNEDIDFMTDEDVDEIFAEKVEEIKVYNSSSEEEIPEEFETSESELYLSVVPELVAYASSGKVTIAKEESEYKVTITGNGSLLFQSVIYPDITKTINITKNEETV